MIVMGTDPGIAKLGYAFIEIKKKEGKLKMIDYGCIITNSNLFAGERLKKINNELNKLIKKHKPNVLAVENIYFFKNLKTVMPVSQAKGIILLTAAKHKIPVIEFTPLQVKMTIVGYGRADKTQIQKMIKSLLNLKELPRPDDAADALAVALTYIYSEKFKLNLSKTSAEPKGS